MAECQLRALNVNHWSFNPVVSIPARLRTFKHVVIGLNDLKLSGQFAEGWWFYPGAYSVTNLHKGAPGVFISQHDQFELNTVEDDLYPLETGIKTVHLLLGQNTL